MAFTLLWRNMSVYLNNLYKIIIIKLSNLYLCYHEVKFVSFYKVI